MFLTHFHADHWLGLPGLLKTFDLRARERPLTVHGPRGLRDLLGPVLRAAGRTRYELVLSELEPGEQLERDGYTDRGGTGPPPRPAYGYVVLRGRAPGGVRPGQGAAARSDAGPEFGRVQRGETIRASPGAGDGAAAAGASL